MASKRGWSRYRPPGEPRTESGAPLDPKPAPKPRSPRKQRTKPKASSAARPGTPWARPLVVRGMGVGVVGGSARAGRAATPADDDTSGDVDLELLDEAFIADGLAAARSEEGDRQPVAVHLDEYSMTVEYFDPAKDESRYVETNSYSDDVTVRVRKNFYTGYDKPTPFDITVVDPAAMVEAARDALADSEDAYTWEVRVSVPPDGTEPLMVARVSGKDTVERTSAP